MWQFWYAALPEGTVQFNSSITDLGDDPLQPTINGQRFDLTVVADGGWSALRTRYFSPAAPVYAGYEAWRFRVRVEHVPGFSAYGEYQGTQTPHTRTILLPVASDDGADWIMGGCVFIPWHRSRRLSDECGSNAAHTAPS